MDLPSSMALNQNTQPAEYISVNHFMLARDFIATSGSSSQQTVYDVVTLADCKRGNSDPQMHNRGSAKVISAPGVVSPSY